MAIEALKTAGADLTREAYLEALADLGTLEFGGFTLVFGPGDNQGSDSVFLTRITSDGSFEAVSPSS